MLPQDNLASANDMTSYDAVGGPAALPFAAPADGTSKPKTAKGKSSKTKKQKQYRAKKPKDMPRRPLSAYNIFFKEERARMLANASEKAASAEIEENEGNEPDAAPSTKGKIGFEAMAKTIGKRWKELEAENLERYKKLAKEDMERYRVEMDKYHLELAKKSRVEREEAAKLGPMMGATNDQMIGGMQDNQMAIAQQMQDPSMMGAAQLDQFLRAQMMAAGNGSPNAQFSGAQMGMPPNFGGFYPGFQGAMGGMSQSFGGGADGGGQQLGQQQNFFPNPMMQGMPFQQNQFMGGQQEALMGQFEQQQQFLMQQMGNQQFGGAGAFPNAGGGNQGYNFGNQGGAQFGQFQQDDQNK
jgi:hypothetical protein